MTAVDLEVPIPQGKSIVSTRMEETIEAAAKMIKGGAKPETLLRTLYLFGYIDGGLGTMK